MKPATHINVKDAALFFIDLYASLTYFFLSRNSRGSIVKNTRLNHLFLLSICFLLSATALSGCAHYKGDNLVPTILATSEAFKAFDGEYENTAYYKNHKPESIAVLPFTALEMKSISLKSKFEHPEDIVRAGMYNHISSLPFRDLEIFDTDTRLKNAGLEDIEAVNRMIAENPKKLKSILGVDAVVSGEVTHFDQIFIGVYSQIAVGCKVQMWDLNTGSLLWRAKHVGRAHAGGISSNPVGLLMAAVAAVWNLRETGMLSQTDDVFREIASTIELPESALAMQASLPKIDLFACINSEKPFTAGQPVSFRLIGDRDCKAYVDLGQFKSAIPLRPLSSDMKTAIRAEVIHSIQDQYRSSGHELTQDLMQAIEREMASREIYEGVYMVAPGEQMYGLMSKAYLVSPSGSQVTTMDPVNIIDIDARPPDTVTGLTSFSLDQRVDLTWEQNIEEDLAGYEVWMSPSPLSGYALAIALEKNAAVIGQLENFEPAFVKVRALDTAGNRGCYSHFAEVIALPEPNLDDLPRPGPSLGGTVAASALLTKDRSPYTVQSDLVVKPGATLHIAPGVEIHFLPGTMLSITGGNIAVYGRENQLVRFSPVSANNTPGSWGGLLLDTSGHAVFKYALIENAETGITIINSQPLITHTTITGASQAGLHLKDNAKPSITCSVLSANQGQGGMVVEGEGIAPFIRNTSFVNNSPFDVQSYAPIELDLTNNYWGVESPGADKFLGQILWEPWLQSPPTRCGE